MSLSGLKLNATNETSFWAEYLNSTPLSVLTNLEDNEEDIYKEDYPLSIKIIFAVVGVISLTSSVLAVLALRRSRKIPASAKLLATGLLTVDCLFILITSTRKFVLDPHINNVLTVAGNAVLQLAYSTVAFMSAERFFVFHRPMTYMRICTIGRVRFAMFFVWGFVITTFYSVRYGVCYAKFRSSEVFYIAGQCNMIVTVHYSLLVITVLTTSMICYCRIFSIVREKCGRKHERRLSLRSVISLMRGFKTTSLVLVYSFVILATSISYVFIIVFMRFFKLGITEIRLSLDAVSIMNCIFDPFLYVLWFRECQMQLFCMLSFINPKFRTRVAKMRIEIFDIVTYDTTLTSYDQKQMNDYAITNPAFNPDII